MNIRIYSGFLKKLKHKLIFHIRLLDAKTKTNSFGDGSFRNLIKRIYVINLDRKPDRWKQIAQELRRIKSLSGAPLLAISRRFSAIDARYLVEKTDDKTLLPYFTLADQLRVEPNPVLKIDASSELHRIKMSPQEIAVALSHIEVWRLVAANNDPYTLVLEDDVYFCHGFSKNMDAVWFDIMNYSSKDSAFDILFLSFQEVGMISKSKAPQGGLARKPECGIWQASGYVLSREGAQKLLGLLPVYGPIDLWLNLQFDKLDVFLTRKPIIEQRLDVPSTNSYSIMPVLSQIGAYTQEKPLVTQAQKLLGPVFAFGEPDSGLSALAMALSMMGYTCCSDILELPAKEEDNLIKNRNKYHFNAYVNVGSLNKDLIRDVFKLYPNARFIFTTADSKWMSILNSKQTLYFPDDLKDKWEALSLFLKCEYPVSPYPICEDIGQQKIDKDFDPSKVYSSYKQLKSDSSPWIISSKTWGGIPVIEIDKEHSSKTKSIIAWGGKRNNFKNIDWKFREDTFPSNLSIFLPKNVKIDDSGVMKLKLCKQITAVRSFTSAAVVTQNMFLYGKFTVEIRPSNVSGLVTGIFLHRNAPHQEIDIEFLGKDTKKMLINVFYNPGSEGAKLEYGYRGTPVIIDLGFDAAIALHTYEIEWSENSIRWRVDGKVVYERVVWNPTPIPNLPMEFNINLWHSRSKELAGKLDSSRIPAYAEIKSVIITSYN
jgi:GR25 family glycosyltransferase involved in LPS biosynthesis